MKAFTRYIFAVILTLGSYIQLSYASLKDDIIPGGSSTVLTGTGVVNAEGEGLLDAIFAFVRDSIFGLLFVIAIGMFLYIGFRLLIARGNPEEFKKALQSFIYAAVGLFVVAFAWALVRLVAGISI